jgi:hypothetical protein
MFSWCFGGNRLQSVALLDGMLYGIPPQFNTKQHKQKRMIPPREKPSWPWNPYKMGLPACFSA